MNKKLIIKKAKQILELDRIEDGIKRREEFISILKREISDEEIAGLCAEQEILRRYAKYL
jgi:hypothetical protein